MTVRLVAPWTDGVQHYGEDMRLAQGALLAPAGAFTARSGVRPGGMAVTQTAVPSMAVVVGAGQALVQGTEAGQDGAYVITNDAAEELDIDDAHATLPRIDLVVARVLDAAYSGAVREARLEVLTGVAASVPGVPALPATAVALGQIAVAALADEVTNANITDRRAYAAALGGIVVCTSATRPAVGLYEGMPIYETDTDSLMVWTGAAWLYPADPKPLCRVQRNADQSIPNAETTTIEWDAELTDIPGGMWAAGQPTRVTAVRTGWHRVTVHTSWEADAAGTRITSLLKNGATTGVQANTFPSLAATFSPPPLVEDVYLTAGEYLEAQVRQSSGSALDLADVAGTSNRMSVMWERP